MAVRAECRGRAIGLGWEASTRAGVQDRSREEDWRSGLASGLLESKREARMVDEVLGDFHKLRICCTRQVSMRPPGSAPIRRRHSFLARGSWPEARSHSGQKPRHRAAPSHSGAFVPFSSPPPATHPFLSALPRWSTSLSAYCKTSSRSSSSSKHGYRHRRPRFLNFLLLPI
ncbi:hypothetical protein VTI74DRAFT_1179 [Chaetomium olivicolor]